jgi:hypothetical protein
MTDFFKTGQVIFSKKLIVDLVEELHRTGNAVSSSAFYWSTDQVVSGETGLFLNKRLVPRVTLEIIYQASFAGLDDAPNYASLEWWFNFMVQKAGAKDGTNLFAAQFHDKDGAPLHLHQGRNKGGIKGD